MKAFYQMKLFTCNLGVLKGKEGFLAFLRKSERGQSRQLLVKYAKIFNTKAWQYSAALA